ncbi:MAG: hypothetical protein ABIX12_02895, partial [Rubrivivax sp.]
PGPAAASPYPIAHTEKLPHNTVVIRPRLLKRLRFLGRIGGKVADPIIEVLPPDDPTKAPRQIRLTIPQGVLAGADAYGFTLSLGWHDPTRELARQVMLCEVDFKALQMRLTDRDNPAAKLRRLFKEQEGDLKKTIFRELEKVEIDLPLIGKVRPLQGDNPIAKFVREEIVGPALEKFIDLLVGLLPTESREEWLFRVGVNGVWVSFFFQPGPKERRVLSANQLVFKFALAKGDELMLGSHGTEFDPVGDLMHAAIRDRTLGFENDPARPVPWSGIVDPVSRAERDRQLFVVMRKLMFDTTEGLSKVSLGFDNSPLGLFDPGASGTGNTTPDDNPIVIGAAIDPPVQVTKRPKFARAIPPEMILVEDGPGGRPDYELQYTISVKTQVQDGDSPA